MHILSICVSPNGYAQQKGKFLMRLLGTARKSEHTNKFMNFRNSFLSTEQSKNVKKIIETYNWARKRPKTIYLAYFISQKSLQNVNQKMGKSFVECPS
jgi:hypothetical protein